MSSNGSVHLSESQGSRRSAAESEKLAKHKRAKIEFQLSEISSSRVRGSSSARLKTAAGDRKNEETPPTQKIEIKIEFVVEVGDRRWMLFPNEQLFTHYLFSPV